MTDLKAYQNMSINQIRSVCRILQRASDGYLYIFDLTDDVYLIPEKLRERFAFDDVRVENCTKAIQKVIYPSDYKRLAEDIARCASGKQDMHDMEYRWVDRENRVIWINCRGTIVLDADGHRLLVGKIIEIGKKAKADNVTGLRREVRFRLNAEEILRDRPESIRYCMRIGIDNFKEINEKDGTEAGDMVLFELSKCIMDTVAEEVDVYRLEADEFMIMDAFSDTEVNPEVVYNKIKAKVEEKVRQKGYSRFYTISAGVLDKNFVGMNSEDIMMLSEFALNEAKRNGRNQMVTFNQNDYDIYLEHLNIRKELRLDISNNFRGFQIYYQPIVDAESFQIIGAEALLRWNSKKFGNISPAIMIPIMEESGLIIPIGRYVLWEAAKMCRKWRETIPNFHINVNLSYVQVHKSDLMSDVQKCMKEVGISPDSIVLELTESGYIETDNRIRELFKNLKENQVDLAIDDFGTGYSNMRYLKEIEAKTVKLDRSFVLQALNNEYDYRLICHLIDMIHCLGSTVCMEGIEYDYELEKMKNAGPDMIQGYLFGKPCPADEFESKHLNRKALA